MSEAEVLAAAKVIAENDEGCASVPPCVSDTDEDECICVKTARQALLAAEKVREPIKFKTYDGLWSIEVNGPEHVIATKLEGNT